MTFGGRPQANTGGGGVTLVLPLGCLVHNTARGHDACTRFVSCVSLRLQAGTIVTTPTRIHANSDIHLGDGYSVSILSHLVLNTLR